MTTSHTASGARARGTGPVVPTDGAPAVLRPLPFDAVRLSPDGFLGAWQDLNARATLPHCVAAMETSGVLHNFRRVTEGEQGGFRGLWFADSDLYKTIEAAAWEHGRTGDEAAARFLDEATRLVERAQEDDGYLDTRFQVDDVDRRFAGLVWSHEMYVAGHLIQAAVAASRVAGRTSLLAVARRVADLLVRRFGDDGRDGVDGHPEVETALVELYRETGESAYLRLASRMVDLRGHGVLARGADEPAFGWQYYQDDVPVREATEAIGHVVRQAYLATGALDVALETADAGLLDAAARLWRSAVGTKTYVTGAQGAHHKDEAYGDAYELPPDRAYAETCASIASFMWSWRLLLATGEGRYADEMERVLYNAIPASTAADGTRFFYANPLQVRSGHRSGSEFDAGERLSWYQCACCPPNLARLVASLHTYAATVAPGALALHLYGTGEVRAAVPDGPGVALRVVTEYPWNGTVGVEVVEGKGRWTLALRVPSWCSSPALSVDDAPVAAEPGADGYVRITRDWRPGDRVRLDLPMPVRVLRAHPDVDAVRGCVALARGPVVHCLEGVDQEDGVRLEDLRVDPEARFEARRSSALPGASIVLVGPGRAVEPAASAPYRDAADAAGRPGRATTVTAIPYARWANRGASPMRVWIPTGD